MTDKTKESETSAASFEADYVAVELELRALNKKLLLNWGCLAGAISLFVASYLAFEVGLSVGVVLVVVALIWAISVGLGMQVSGAKNRSRVVPVLASRLGLDGTLRVADMYQREGMIENRVRCFAAIADRQDRYLVQLIEAKEAGSDGDVEFEGIALRARCSVDADDLMLRRKTVLTRVVDWFLRGPWEYSAALNQQAPHPRFGIYVRRGIIVSQEAYAAFAQRIEIAQREANLCSGFIGAYCTRGWVTLLIDGAPRKWLNVGMMFDGPAKRAERAKAALAEIAELARGGEALWRQFNDQSS